MYVHVRGLVTSNMEIVLRILIYTPYEEIRNNNKLTYMNP